MSENVEKKKTRLVLRARSWTHGDVDISRTDESEDRYLDTVSLETTARHVVKVAGRRQEFIGPIPEDKLPEAAVAMAKISKCRHPFSRRTVDSFAILEENA